jgi:cyclopropane fatty-acyl-phospholipid synthase-like methyltransferase
VLDLGCGDGRLAELVLHARPSVASIVAVDRSAAMLALARERFKTDTRVRVHEWDLRQPLTPWGRFDVVLSGFAIHHLEHPRKRELFEETANQLNTGGVFLNLEVVASATPERHAEFLHAIGRTADDPEDRLATIEDQLQWMRNAGMVNVDCLWHWRGFALLVGEIS